QNSRPYKHRKDSNMKPIPYLGNWNIPALMILLTIGCGDEKWHHIENEAGGYSIDFPDEPHDTVRVMLKSGARLPLHVQEFSTKNGIHYSVLYGTIAVEDSSNTSIQTMLNRMRDKALKNTHGKLLFEKEITVQNYSGRDLKIEIENVGIIWIRVLIV